MGKGSSPPPSPDYATLIPLQTKANLDTFNTMLKASRVTQNTPYGSSGWTVDKDGNWTNNQTLSPEQQGLYQKNVNSQLQQADLLSGLTSRVADSTSTPLSFTGGPRLTGSLSTSSFQTPTFADNLRDPSAPDSRATNLYAGLASPQQYAQNAADAQYNAQTRYLQPQQQQQRQSLESRLAEQGFVPGTPAYSQAMGDLNRTQDMALAQARDSATLQGAQVGNQQFNNDLAGRQFGAAEQNANYGRDLSGQQFQFAQDTSNRGMQREQTQDANSLASLLFNQSQQAGVFGNQARNQYISELLAQRQYPLNELNALRSGTQVTNPSLTAQYSTPNLQTVDQLGAAQNNYNNQLGAYNAQVSSDNALLGTIGGVAGSIFGGPMGGMIGSSLLSGLGGGGAGVVSGGSGFRP